MEQNTVSTEKKTFTTTQRSMLLASARNLIRNLVLKKDKHVKERNKIRDNFEAALEADIQKRIVKMREDGKVRLEKRLAKLNKTISDMDEVQKSWEKPIIDMTGFRMEDMFDYEMKSGDDGSNRLVVSFKYPETVIPPVSELEPECPCHEDAEHDIDIDEDMSCENTAVSDYEESAQPVDESEPEYDSAGFSAEDGLQEGEPAELAETIAEEEQSFELKDSDVIDHEFGNDFDEDVKVDAADESDDPFFLG